MIKSFRDKETERIFPAPFLQAVTARSASSGLTDARNAGRSGDIRRSYSSSRESSGEAVRDRKGQNSIRINDQWRICFRWIEGNAHEVEITDYH